MKHILIPLFTNYYKLSGIRKAGVSRYSFDAGNLSFNQVYHMVIKSFLPEADLCDLYSYYLEAILIVQTKPNLYYCTIFRQHDRHHDIHESLQRFEIILHESNLKYKKYIENKENSNEYEGISDIILKGEYIGENEDRTHIYPYWQWIYDMTSNTIQKIVLLDSENSDCYNVIPAKNIFATRPYIVKALQNPNFYYIHLTEVYRKVDKQIIQDLKMIKQKTVQMQQKYLRSTNIYQRFKQYWNYVPSRESYLPINYVGLVDFSLRFGYSIWFTEIPCSESKINVETLHTLFSQKFIHIQDLQAVVMYQPQDKNIFTYLFIIDNQYPSNRFEKLLVKELENPLIELKPLSLLDYDFTIPDNPYEEWDYRRIKIKINSLIVGLYCRDTDYYNEVTSTFGGDDRGMIQFDVLNDETTKAKSTWFTTVEDRKFMQHYNPKEIFLFIRHRSENVKQKNSYIRTMRSIEETKKENIHG